MRASVSVFVHHLALTLCFSATFCDLSKKKKTAKRCISNS